MDKAFTMNTGKAIKQDPRSAPDNAPSKAPEVMDKEMPEYPMDNNELKYPGEGSPFSTKDPRNGPTGGSHGSGNTPHSAVPRTEVPRNKLHLTTAEMSVLLDSLTACATACERCAAYCRDRNNDQRTAPCLTTSKACADICILLHTYVAASHHAEIVMLSKDLAAVCARVCETCALECGKHPDMQACIKCEAACRACAEQCRSYAR